MILCYLELVSWSKYRIVYCTQRLLGRIWGNLKLIWRLSSTTQQQYQQLMLPTTKGQTLWCGPRVDYTRVNMPPDESLSLSEGDLCPRPLCKYLFSTPSVPQTPIHFCFTVSMILSNLNSAVWLSTQSLFNRKQCGQDRSALRRSKPGLQAVRRTWHEVRTSSSFYWRNTACQQASRARARRWSKWIQLQAWGTAEGCPAPDGALMVKPKITPCCRYLVYLPSRLGTSCSSQSVKQCQADPASIYHPPAACHHAADTELVVFEWNLFLFSI